MFINRNTRSLARIELTDEQIHNEAPSVFAVQPVSTVSDKYTFLPTSQIIGRMRQEGWAPVNAEQQRVRVEHRRGFQKHLVRFQRRETIARVGEYAAEICLVNSHDGGSAYQIHAALFRFVCANGLMVSDGACEHIAIRHSGHEADEVIEASFRMLASIPQLTQNVEAFRSRQLTAQEQHDFAAQAILLRWDDAKLAPVNPAKLLWPRRSEDAGNDLWSTFNRVQENLLQGGLKDYTRRNEDGHRFARTRAVTGLDENVKLNKALWELAEMLRTGRLPGAQN